MFILTNGLSNGCYTSHFREEERGLRDFRQVASAKPKQIQALATLTPDPTLFLPSGPAQVQQFSPHGGDGPRCAMFKKIYELVANI